MRKPTELFGKNLKAALNAERNQTWLAEKVEVRVATISDYINGKAFPNLKIAEAIAQAVGRPLTSLLGSGEEIVVTSRDASDEELRLEAVKLVLALEGRDNIQFALKRLRDLIRPTSNTATGAKKPKPSAG